MISGITPPVAALAVPAATAFIPTAPVFAPIAVFVATAGRTATAPSLVLFLLSL